jgi:hypothetical protein
VERGHADRGREAERRRRRVALREEGLFNGATVEIGR